MFGVNLLVGLLGVVCSAALDGPVADRPVQTVEHLRPPPDRSFDRTGCCGHREAMS